MRNKPTISVIIPTYNMSQYITHAVDSIFNQTFQDFEIIVVDDGSTDDSKDIVNEYIEKYPHEIRYFYQENKGPGTARNRGIKEAKGEYIAFLDADDTLMENSLYKRKSFLDKYLDISLVFTDYHIKEDCHYTECSRLKKKKFLDFFKDVASFMKKDEIIFKREFYPRFLEFSPHPIFTGTVMMRRKIVESIGLFRTDILIGEDNDYWIRVIKKFKTGYINEPLSSYNRIFSSLTKQTERYYLDSLRFYKELYINNNGKKVRKIARKEIALAYYELGYYYNKRCLRNRAVRYLLKSILYNPQKKEGYKCLLSILIPYSMYKNNWVQPICPK